MKSNLPVLLLRNMVLFPYNEIRIEFDSEEDKKLLYLSESCYDNNILIVEIDDSDYEAIAEKVKLTWQII